jgi:amino acid adenylation domain-containing protein
MDMETRSSASLTALKEAFPHSHFDSIIGFENYPDVASWAQNPDLCVSIGEYNEKVAIPLLLRVGEYGSIVTIRLIYVDHIFGTEEMLNVVQVLERIIDQVRSDPTGLISELETVPETMMTKIIGEWNDTKNSFPSHLTIHQVFEERVAQVPHDTTALVYQAQILSYRQLSSLSNQLASYIKSETNVEPGTLIGLFLNRNVDMVIGILAVLKSGAAYVPMDIQSPKLRLQAILADTGVEVVLLNQVHIDLITEVVAGISGCTTVKMLPIDTENSRAKIARFPEHNIESTTHSTDICYCIYTSGSTGVPKGALLEHRGVVNTIIGYSKIFGPAPTSIQATMITSYVFDVSVLELFAPLFNGGTVHLIDDDLRLDPALFSEYVLEEKISYIYFPLALLALFPVRKYPELRAITVGGELCDTSLANTWSSVCSFYNLYGTTETTCIDSCTLLDMTGNTRSIGCPLPNTIFYVLSPNLRQVPVLGQGELFVGGIGVGRAYLNRPQITAERYIPNPFKGSNSYAWAPKLYSTRDVVRRLLDGTLECLGRLDIQIKIHGFRIELCEIEQVLRGFPGVIDSVVEVIERNGGRKVIVGFYTSNDGEADREKLRFHLKAHLPSYMVPSVMVFLNTIPVMVSGKVDRKALRESGSHPQALLM